MYTLKLTEAKPRLEIFEVNSSKNIYYIETKFDIFTLSFT